jgi:arylsulfatase A-like enzyme
VDQWCGHLLNTLDALGLGDDTLVVFTSDHGTMMGEQGEIHKGIDRVRIQVSRCPLILRYPDRAHAGQVVEGFLQHQDLMPTLLHLLGEPVPERCNGENAWPLVTGERRGGLRDVVISAFGWYASVRTREWNYLTAWVQPLHGRVRPPELYDRRRDPEELTSRIDEYPEVARELQSKLDQVLTGPAGPSTMRETETPAAVPGVKW